MSAAHTHYYSLAWEIVFMGGTLALILILGAFQVRFYVGAAVLLAWMLVYYAAASVMA